MSAADAAAAGANASTPVAPVTDITSLINSLILMGPTGLPTILGLPLSLAQNNPLTTFLIGLLLIGGPFFAMEAFPAIELAYSKFASRGGKDKWMQIASKPGFVILYAPSAVFGILATMFMLPTSNNADALNRLYVVDILIFIHFAKRVYESLFVHIYSGTMAFASSILIALAYLTISAIVHFAVFFGVKENPEFYANQHWAVQTVGLITFFVGAAGNYYHHALMASWRKAPKKGGKKGKAAAVKKYVVPHGGMFPLIACPHYFFEIITWLGLGIFSSTLWGFMGAAISLGYLGMRSAKTSAWYREKMEDYPKNRKNLIPFIY
ncbi:hypothetical protein HDU96_010195 [Phlyctochytrium bullatum]|nr:hypothetical protein HDU96_010195 [Phlyctochytrium bullatum]